MDEAGNPGNESAPVYVVYKPVNEERIQSSADKNTATLPEEGNTLMKNETVNASGDKPEGIFGLLSYIVIGIAMVITSILLYSKITGTHPKESDVYSWVVSGIRKEGGEYEISVNQDDKRRTIRLNEKLYEQLIKKKRLVFGKHTIVIKPKG